MKGIVFCEFLNMVDRLVSPEMTETIIEKAALASKGAYTTVGTYPHHEIISLVSILSEEIETPVDELLNSFGKHLFNVFIHSSHIELNGFQTSFDLLEQVDSYIHKEVKKLYPDAKLPKLKAERLSPSEMQITYSSTRAMADLAYGLIEACIMHFGDGIKIERKDIEKEPEQVVHFILSESEGSP